jgi:hypothetical protein
MVISGINDKGLNSNCHVVKGKGKVHPITGHKGPEVE